MFGASKFRQWLKHPGYNVATATYTLTQGVIQTPKRLHSGLNVVAFSKTLSQFHATAGSAVILAKIPNKARIVDSFVGIGDVTATVTAALYQLQVGTTGIGATFSNAAGASGRGLGGNFKVSLSDDAAVQTADLRLVCTTAGSASTSMSLAGWVSYLTDGSDLNG